MYKWKQRTDALKTRHWQKYLLINKISWLFAAKTFLNVICSFNLMQGFLTREWNFFKHKNKNFVMKIFNFSSWIFFKIPFKTLTRCMIRRKKDLYLYINFIALSLWIKSICTKCVKRSFNTALLKAFISILI